MRFAAATCLAFAVSAVSLVAPVAGAKHGTVTDNALHCAALAQLTLQILQDAGELADEDRQAVEVSIDRMLTQSTLPDAKRKRA
jgi:hypothetical protein